jgi:hypothetical protein
MRRGRHLLAHQVMIDLKNLFREEAAHCRRLAEIATDSKLKQELLEMATRFQAKADEHSDERQSKQRQS